MHSVHNINQASALLGSISSHTADILAKALADDSITEADALHLLQAPPADFAALLQTAGLVRDRIKGRVVTYSPKAFFPVTNLCLDRCSYCTFRQDPGAPGAHTMRPKEVREIAQRAAAMGCIEALMCLGDKPERAFRSYRQTLASIGHESTVSYVAECCETALDEGLLPHTNAGVLTRDDMRQLRSLNVSLGLMLESVSQRLRQRGQAHASAPDKEPALRLRMIREAGELQIAFTTGILLGIGENQAERAATLAAIADLHDEFGHIQEIIVQNFRAKPSTRMAAQPEPESYEIARVVAVARLMMPTMNIQVPPNLNPYDFKVLLSAGINDWGGISPLTMDFVNPEAPWPEIQALKAACSANGYTLHPRLPVYSEYCANDFIDPSLRTAVDAHQQRIGGSHVGLDA